MTVTATPLQTELFMKKLLSLILTTILALSVLPSLVACNPNEEPEGPVYSEEFVFDDTHHWKPQINGEGDPIEYGAHVNPKTGSSVGKCKCGYYFPCHNLVYNKITLNGVEGYELVDYDEDMSPQFYHVEVPKYYQGEDDDEALPVLSIAKYALSAAGSSGKCDVKLKSIKLNEGLLKINNYAFAYSDITEMYIPDSVTGDLRYTFVYCSLLEKVVVGNGVERICGYFFLYCSKVETLILGNSVREIQMRSFIGCSGLRTLVLPASLVSIPEGTHLMNQDAGWGVESDLLPGSDINVYFQITRDQLEERTIPLFPRDDDGNLLNPDGSIAHKVNCIYNADGTIFNFEQKSTSTYGLTQNWAGDNNVYCLDEWHYDSNGNPVPN